MLVDGLIEEFSDEDGASEPMDLGGLGATVRSA